MSHELRTPLNHVIGFSDLIRQRAGDAQVANMAKLVHQSGEHLLEIIEDIFELAVADQSSIKVKKNPVVFHDFFVNAQAMLENYLQSSGKGDDIELVYSPDEKLMDLSISIDATKVQQIISNLFRNAVKFTNKGQIEFGFYSEHKEAICFWVRDTGIGIAPRKQQYIFEAFSQADNSHTRQYGGLGIGLAITKKIVDILGGTIQFDSEPGKGSTFRVSVPTEIAHHPIRWLNKGQKPAQTNRRVLIVDDDPYSLELISAHANSLGIAPETACNGKEALAMMEKMPNRFDLIFMDIHMPVMNGLEATKTINSLYGDIPVVAITAYAMQTDRNELVRTGFDDILQKPIKYVDIVSLLSSYGILAPEPAGEC